MAPETIREIRATTLRASFLNSLGADLPVRPTKWSSADAAADRSYYHSRAWTLSEQGSGSALDGGGSWGMEPVPLWASRRPHGGRVTVTRRDVGIDRQRARPYDRHRWQHRLRPPPVTATNWWGGGPSRNRTRLSSPTAPHGATRRNAQTPWPKAVPTWSRNHAANTRTIDCGRPSSTAPSERDRGPERQPTSRSFRHRTVTPPSSPPRH
jgi:hypothetical protein